MDLVGLRIPIDASPATKGAAEVNRAFDSIPPHAQSAVRATEGMERSFESLETAAHLLEAALAALGVEMGFRQLVETMRGFQQMETTILAVAGSTQAAAEQTNFLRGEIDRLGLPLLQTGQQYAAFLAAVKGTSLEGDKAKQVFSGMAEALTALHMPMERAQRAWIAVQEIASMGTVTAAHLTRQLAIDIPGAANLMAQGLGVSTQGLHEMMKAGELTAAVALPAMAKAMHDQYGAAALAAKDMTQGLTNQLQTSFAEMQEIIINSGFEEGFRDLMHDLIKIMKDPEFQSAIADIGINLGKALKLAGEGAKFLAENLNLIKDALIAIGSYKLTGILIALFDSGVWQSIAKWSAATELSIGGIAESLLAMAALPAALLTGGIFAVGKSLDDTRVSLDYYKQINNNLDQINRKNAAMDKSSADQFAAVQAGLGPKLQSGNVDLNARPGQAFSVSADPEELSKKQRAAMETIAKQWRTLQDQIRAASQDAIDKIQDKWDKHLRTVQDGLKKVPGLRKEAADLEVEIERAKNEEIRELFVKYAKDVNDDKLDPIDKIKAKYDEHLKQARKVFDQLAANAGQAAQLIQDIFARMSRDIDKTLKELQDKATQAIGALADKDPLGKALGEAITPAPVVYLDVIRRMSVEVPKVKDQFGLLKIGLQGLQNGFDSFFTGLATGTIKASEAFKQMATSIVAEILKIIAKMLVLMVVQRITGFFAGGAGTSNAALNANVPNGPAASAGNIFGGVGSGNVFALGGVMTSTGAVPLRSFGNGGVTNRRMFAEFGEGSQPEAFVPLPDGRSIPVTLDGQSSKAPTVSVQVINKGQPVDARHESTKWDPSLHDMVVQIVLEDQAQNGPIRRSQGGR